MNIPKKFLKVWDTWKTAIDILSKRCSCQKPVATIWIKHKLTSIEDGCVGYWFVKRNSEEFGDLVYSAENIEQPLNEMQESLIEEIKELTMALEANKDDWYPDNEEIHDEIKKLCELMTGDGYDINSFGV